MTTTIKLKTCRVKALLKVPVLLTLVLFARPVLAETVAVIPVAFAETPASLDQATRLAASLSEKGYQVLSQEQVVKRLMQDRWPAALDIKALNQELDAESRGQSDLAKSVKRLQSIVDMLQNDPAPSDDKIRLMQRARLMLARNLYQLAFMTGDRKKNQQIQQRIFANLEAAVRSDPFVTMPLDKFSPEVRRLLDQARARVVKAGNGRLELHCDRSDGEVFIDGRQLGHCPLFIDDQRPLGTYRLWVKSPDCRSRTHQVKIQKGLNQVEISMSFDCAVDANDGSLHVAENAIISDSMAIDAGLALGVDLLVVSGIVQRDDGDWAFAVLYDVKLKKALRRGAVRLQEPVQQQLDQLASFLHQPASAGTKESKTQVPFALPVEGQVQSASLDSMASATDDPMNDPLLLGAMISGGIAGLGLLGAGVGLAIWGTAYNALAQPFVPRNELDGLTAQAGLGWSMAGIGGTVGLLGALVSGGLLLYRQLGQEGQESQGEAQNSQGIKAKQSTAPAQANPDANQEQDSQDSMEDAAPQGPVPSLGFLQEQNNGRDRQANLSQRSGEV